jgi:2-hydroxycyclohexanecarboxyl-CoA dehydrogenase
LSDGARTVRVPQFDIASVLIAGGTAGVGLASAFKFAEAGVRRLALMGRDPKRGEAARAQIAAKYPAADIRFLQGDANIPADAERVCAAVVAAFGGIDILLCSTVGAAAPALFKTLPIAELEAILLQQAMGPIVMSRAVMPSMCDSGGGVILNIASDAAKVATPGETVIGAAMAAIVMFSRGLAIEAKRDGIRVNALTPSLIEGTLTHARMQQDPFASRLFGKAAQAAHLGVAQADDLADLAVFLASPAAAKITGQAISANGGISAA